jgi:uncharacterized protein YndB with AHSA1/START domain
MRMTPSAIALACPSSLSISHRYPAPPAVVFAAWTHPALARRWLFASAGRALAQATLEARPGGALLLRDHHRGRTTEHRGTFLAVAAPGRLAFTLVVPEAPGTETVVDVSIEPQARGCRLALVHAGVPPAALAASEARWLGALYGLGETLAAVAEARASAPDAAVGRAG